MRIHEACYLLLLTAYCALIFYLSHQPALPLAELFPHQDKIYHLLAYALMGILAWHAFSSRFAISKALWLSVVLFCSLYGASDEFHQSFIDGRNSDIADWLTDTLGAALAAGALYYRLRFSAAAQEPKN